jgi:ABC-type molybdenum transport system ATPase subunit/photorepair protein PhrA
MEVLKLNYGAEKLFEFSTRNCAILWTNGTGKSTLSKIINEFNNHILPIELIRAQRDLTINQGELRWIIDEDLRKSLSSYSAPKVWNNLSSAHLQNELIKNYHNNITQTDFNRNIEQFFREDNNAHSDASRNYNGWDFKKPNTRAEIIFSIWNNTFLDKKIGIFEWKIQISLIKGLYEKKYEIENLSDWERSALYLITKCIYAPKNWLIIIDEWETHLNPALLYELWDNIERTRLDCRFLYVSHSIDFITSRTDCSKFWIKSFTHPTNWELEEIDNEELPEELTLQIIWTKKHKVLFIESNESKDRLLYQKIYPEYKVMPVGSCDNVINFTKSLRKVSGTYNKEYFWLIDRDFRNVSQIKVLESDGIFCLPVAEFENLFFREEIVKYVFSHLWRQSEFEEKFIDLKKSVFALKTNVVFKECFYKNYILQKFNQSLSGFKLLDCFKFENDYLEVNSFWKLVEDEEDYNNFLQVLNDKSITGKASELWFNWVGYRTQVLNIFNTEKSDEFREVFMWFMPSIKNNAKI